MIIGAMLAAQLAYGNEACLRRSPCTAEKFAQEAV